jgi:hypothetical protein
LLAFLYSAASVSAETTALQFDQLPEPVRNTVSEILDRSQISRISQINDNNLIRFEIEADKTENKQELMTWDIVVAANGKLMKLTKEVPYFSLSYPQMQAIEARYPGIKVTETESVDVRFFDIIGEVKGRPARFRLYDDGFIEEQL